MNRFKQLRKVAHLIAIALCVTLFLASCDKKETEEKPEQTDNITWKITSDGTLIVSGTGKIPDYNSTIDVPFYDVDRSAITAVVIEDGVTYVGDYAFAVCNSLMSVTIGNSVTAIGEWAFHNCQRLTKVTIGNSVTSIGNYAFSESISLTEIAIPNSVTSIGGDAFWSGGLISVTIGNSVASIENAFDYCLGLTEINVNADNSTFSSEIGVLFNKAKTAIIRYPAGKTDASYIIPGSVEYIGENAFAFCKGLTTITFPNSVTSIDVGAFQYSGLMSVTIGNSVTYIGNYAFSSCNLTSATIGNSVKTIGEGAFANSYDLKEVIIGNSVTSIERGTFAYCRGLTGTLTIPNSVESIGYDAFTSCSGLTEVIIGNSVKSIDEMAFSNCSSLTSITFGNSVESIGYAAFWGCSALTGALTIPNSVTSIGRAAFNFCSGLTSVTIPSSVESIGYFPFANCDDLMSINVDAANSAYCSNDGVLFDKAKNTLIQYPGGKTGIYIIPNSVESVGDGAFGGCIGLTEVTILNSITSIGISAFSGCSSLTTVNFNAVNCTIMANEGRWQVYTAFDYDCKLTTVNIGNEVKTISDYAFHYCRDLTEIVNHATTPQTLSSNTNAFSYVNKNTCLLRVPAGSVADYQAANGWKDFKNIVAIE